VEAAQADFRGNWLRHFHAALVHLSISKGFNRACLSVFICGKNGLVQAINLITH
jgi:hypothetical protein